MAALGEGDVLLVQFPLVAHTVFTGRIMRECQRRGARVVLVVHDLETLRAALRGDAGPLRRLRLLLEEQSALKAADYVVAHNASMTGLLESECGVSSERILTLGIFDYLMPDGHGGGSCRCELEGPLVVSGNLSPDKAAYAYSLPGDIPFNLYGVGYAGEGRENVSYFGSFAPDDLPGVIEGSFGVVWDGESCETCSGVYGEYLRVNNPHKTSSYLAMGLPVLIWDQAALAPFILENGLGMAAPSIAEGWRRVQEMTVLEYEGMRRRVKEMSEKLRGGYFTKQVVESLHEKLRGGVGDCPCAFLRVVHGGGEPACLARLLEPGGLRRRVDDSVGRAA